MNDPISEVAVLSEPKVFLQTRPTTCAVACMMMSLNAFRGSPLSVDEETRHYEELRIPGSSIVPAASIAARIRHAGLEARIRHETPERFWRRMAQASPDLVRRQHDAYLAAEEAGVVFEQHTITTAALAEEIAANRLVMFGINMGAVKHAVLLYRGDADGFWLVDPLIGRSQVNADVLLDRGTFDVGRWYIAIGRLSPGVETA
jgi:hypothetical protein